MNYVERRPWWRIQSPNKGRKKKAKGYDEREIRSSLLILDLKDGKLQDPGKQEEGKMFHKLHVFGMMVIQLNLAPNCTRKLEM